MKNRQVIIACALALLYILTGCAVGMNYGRLEQSVEITQAFAMHQVLPDYKYYYRGLFSKIYVIAGIDRKYELTDELWENVDLNAASLQQLMNQMFNRYGHQPYGAFILDSTGNKIGIWYSSLDSATIKMNASDQITLLSPEALYKGGGR